LALIEVLDISHNKLKQLPEEIGYLKNLRVFKILCIIVHFIYSIIIFLQVLSASHNQIAQLPNSLTQLLKLQELNLSDNCLSHVPDFVANLPSLQSININSNPIIHLPHFKDIVNTGHSKSCLIGKIKFFNQNNTNEKCFSSRRKNRTCNTENG